MLAEVAHKRATAECRIDAELMQACPFDIEDDGIQDCDEKVLVPCDAPGTGFGGSLPHLNAAEAGHYLAPATTAPAVRHYTS